MPHSMHTGRSAQHYMAAVAAARQAAVGPARSPGTVAGCPAQAQPGEPAGKGGGIGWRETRRQVCHCCCCIRCRARDRRAAALEIGPDLLLRPAAGRRGCFRNGRGGRGGVPWRRSRPTMCAPPRAALAPADHHRMPPLAAPAAAHDEGCHWSTHDVEGHPRNPRACHVAPITSLDGLRTSIRLMARTSASVRVMLLALLAQARQGGSGWTAGGEGCEWSLKALHTRRTNAAPQWQQRAPAPSRPRFTCCCISLQQPLRLGYWMSNDKNNINKYSIPSAVHQL